MGRTRERFRHDVVVVFRRLDPLVVEFARRHMNSQPRLQSCHPSASSVPPSSSSSWRPFSPEIVKGQVPKNRRAGVPYYPPADAQWHYACPAGNVFYPKSEKAAFNPTASEEWKAAMAKELKAMDELRVFEYCSLPVGANLITCTWIFLTKWNADGSWNK